MEQHRLHRSLNAFDLTVLGVGAIIGVGIFVLTGTAAAKYAGPGILLSLVISSCACLFTALCYAEFASLIPASGSAYNYAYATLGEMIAWIIGWDLILEYIVACIAVSIGWSGYFVNILASLGIHVPAWCASAPGTTPEAINKSAGCACCAFSVRSSYSRHQGKRSVYERHGFYQGAHRACLRGSRHL